MRAILSTLIAATLCTSAVAQTSNQTPAPPHTNARPSATSPIGHWIANHTAKETLALWWDFRADGELIVNAGGIANGVYTLKGNTLTLPPSEPGATPGVFDIHFTDGKLYTTAQTDNPPTMEFTRVGTQTDSNSAIIGTWRMTSAPHATDPDQEAIHARMMNMIVVYGADGSYHARMPIQTFTGHWNAATHTYKLADYPTLHYHRQGNNLLIAVPPNGKDQHVYLPDPIATP
jgi:hypothetical protein